MATYTPESLAIKAPAGGFQQGGWYNGRQYWGGTLSDAGVIHPASNQPGAGAPVNPEVNAASAALQGVSPDQFNRYLQEQNKKSPAQGAQPQFQPTFQQPGTSQPPQGGVGAGAAQITTPAAPDLTELYKQLYEKADVSGLETQYSQMERDFIEAKGKINDNPFLSEGGRVGREAKLQKLFDERTANIRGEIATKKADVETQLNLKLKQFDLNSQAAKQGLEQLNSLLSMGALDGASGETIANLTRTTGISSDMIYSAIKTNQQKNVNTQVISSTNDAGVVTVSVINTDTGELVKQSSLGAIGNAQQSGGTKEDTQKRFNSDMTQRLLGQTGPDGYVSAEAWRYQKDLWLSAGLSGNDFDSIFRTRFTNPQQDPQYYGFVK